ncbi:N-Dimethylarginine dimethylaminohydrolase [Streptomyces zhaozhouensis]|uniref:N-Dimethylarginine dimethylaminohydrolase n=1 Tax=Streptomyces zhaozhouensis TaxID=1300267 RepID=A0A286DK96_9ACTN|nr:N-Dimethylarginine dimethylaminohydrolase [Streptomyces zhaozhouensis]
MYRPRRYLMCPPEHFRVTYSINPWMDLTKPVDVRLAMAQWSDLRDCYRSLGHSVDELTPHPDLPDLVFTANGGLQLEDRVLGARFAHPERYGEATVHEEWHREQGRTEFQRAQHTNEGEGDFAVTADWLLAGHGFRSSPLAPQEAQEYFGRPVIALDLVDPRFYHLDTALCVLDDGPDGEEGRTRGTVMYYPGAFSPGSRAVLRRLFPDALVAAESDALALGMNAVSDGHHVVLPQAAVGLLDPLRERGFEPVPIDLSELLKAGGSVKCCTGELR